MVPLTRPEVNYNDGDDLIGGSAAHAASEARVWFEDDKPKSNGSRQIYGL